VYLTAHRVVSTTSGIEGVNAFYHVHGTGWTDLDSDPETAPGQLVRINRALPAGGNRVRSYLDVIAPDMTSPGAIIGDFQHFVLGHSPEQFPCEFRGAVARVRMGIERSLAASWRAEAQRLFYECLHVWMEKATTGPTEPAAPQSR
jgi:hypothetical protein